MIDKVANDLICYLQDKSGFEGAGLGVSARSGDFLLLFQQKGAAGEYEAVRIDDRKGNGFYIRLRDGSIEETPRVSRGGSCERSSQVRAACRLVIQSRDFEISRVYEVFRAALTSYLRIGIGAEVQSVDASIRKVVFDFSTIVIEESTVKEREEMTGWEGMINLLAIDFDLNYIHENCGCMPEPLC